SVLVRGRLAILTTAADAGRAAREAARQGRVRRAVDVRRVREVPAAVPLAVRAGALVDPFADVADEIVDAGVPALADRGVAARLLRGRADVANALDGRVAVGEGARAVTRACVEPLRARAQPLAGPRAIRVRV